MKRIIFLLIPVIAIAIFSSCKKQLGGDGSSCGDKEVDLKISTAIATRAPLETAAEKAVKTIDLLVFKRDASDPTNPAKSTFQYSRYGWLKSGSTYSSTLKIDQHLDIYVAINASTLVNSGVIAPDMTWELAKMKLVLLNPDQIDVQANGLPMWGYVASNFDVVDQPTNHLGTVDLFRSVASADIEVTASNFTLSQGSIAYAATKGYLVYDPSCLDPGVNIFTSANIPAGTMFNCQWNKTPAPSENKIVNTFYMYEQAIVSGQSNTKIILKGKWSASTKTEDTYYPIAFRNSNTNEKLPIIRNTKYYINVTNVNGDGYDTYEEAKNAEGVNMDYVVIPWDNYEDGDIQIDGNKYFAMGSKVATLTRLEGSEKQLTFQTDFALNQIEMSFDGINWVNTTINANNRFKVDVKTLTDSKGVPYTCFVITTKLPYGTTDNPAVMKVKVGGRILFDIKLIQVDSDDDDWVDGGDIGQDF